MKMIILSVFDFFDFMGLKICHLSCYLLIFHRLVQFVPILMQINPEIQGDANLHQPAHDTRQKQPAHDRVKSLLKKISNSFRTLISCHLCYLFYPPDSLAYRVKLENSSVSQCGSPIQFLHYQHQSASIHTSGL